VICRTKKLYVICSMTCGICMYRGCHVDYGILNICFCMYRGLYLSDK